MSNISIIEGSNILLAKMPTSYKFRASEVLQYFANTAKLYLAFRGTIAPLDGEILVLKLGSKTLTFTFESGYAGVEWNKIKPIADFGNLDDWMKYFVNSLANVPYINQNYFVSGSGNYISSTNSVYTIIEAREPGDWDIIIDAATTMTYVTADTSILHETNDVGYKQSLKLVTNLDIYKDIHHNLKNTFIKDLVAYTTPDTTSNTGVFNLNDIPSIISSNLSYDIPLQLEHAFLYRKNHCWFTFKTFLSNHSALGTDDRAVEINELESSNVKNEILAINGALPIRDSNYDQHFEDVDESTAPYSWIYETYPNITKFLTFQDRKKIIDKRMPNWLSFIINKNNTDVLKLRVICYNNTGGSAVNEITIKETNVKKGIICIPTGYYQLNIDNILPNTFKYTVEIIDYSEVFTYLIDNTEYKYTKYFVYLNALACIETIRFTGVNEFSIKKDIVNYKTIYSRNTNQNTGSMEMVHTEMDEQIIARTGFIDNRIELDAYKEVIQSPYLAEIINPKYNSVDTFENIPVDVPVESTFRKMIILSDSIDFFKDNSFTYGLEFKLKPAHNDLTWSSIKHRDQIYLDNDIEIDVFVSEVGEDIIWDGIIGMGLKVFVNNKYIDDISYTFTTVGKHSIRIRGLEIKTLKLNTNSSNLQIRFIKIDCFSIDSIIIQGFANMWDRYLTNRVLNMQNLTSIIIVCAGFLYINDILLNLQILSDKYGILSYVKITNMPSTPIKTNVYNYLTSEGLTIIY